MSRGPLTSDGYRVTDNYHAFAWNVSSAIAEETNATYEQILGNIDGLGQLNSWGNAPKHWIESSHTTNTKLPLPMRVAQLTHEAQAPQAQARRRRRSKELVGFVFAA